MVLPLSQVYIGMIDAFKTDCNNLIEQFKKKKSADFRDFLPVWKEFKFTLIYEKYSKYGHTYDFKEDSLHIAKVIMLNDHFVGGLYLLYGLYNIQFDPKPGIRLQLEEYEKIISLIKEERSTLVETCMPGYIFAKMLRQNFFTFVRYAREYSMEGLNRNRLIHSSQATKTRVNLKDQKTIEPISWLHDFVKKFDFIEHLKKIEGDYYNAKKKLKERYPELNLAVDVMQDDTIKNIENDILEVANQTSAPPLSPESTPIGEKRRNLKRRKMKIKHRCEKADEQGAGPSTQPQPQPQAVTKRRRGRPLGHRMWYLNSVINAPSENEDSCDSEPEGLKISLPQIAEI